MGVSNGQRLIHHEHGGELELIPLVVSVLKSVGLCLGNLPHSLQIDHLLLGGGGQNLKLPVELLLRVTDDGEGQVTLLHLPGQLGGIGLEHHQHLSAGTGDLIVLEGELMDIILAERTAVVAQKNQSGLSRCLFHRLREHASSGKWGIIGKIGHLFALIQLCHSKGLLSIRVCPVIFKYYCILNI